MCAGRKGRQQLLAMRLAETLLLALVHLAGCIAIVGLSFSATADSCTNAVPGQKQLLWGDLHVHTAYSLDAWAFGATATPRDAYAFARGQSLRLANGELKTIDRPLDFVAVTDHPETWDQMYTCTDPELADNAHCTEMRALHKDRQSLKVFYNYLIPMVSAQPPKLPEFCDAETGNCTIARTKQWRRAQYAANEANEPCEFTALIGYEWTATPGGHHWHRNVIFRSDAVTPQAYDFVRFPTVHGLWGQLDKHCLAQDGCGVLTIPHNINWADGGPTFAIETETDQQRALRSRFERVAEIFQEKGGSECLPERQEDLDDDCNFNLIKQNPGTARLGDTSGRAPAEAWQQARSSYYRTLLGRGLVASRAGDNPLMLGAIASTDTHFGTPGRVAEADYKRGISTMFATDEEQLANVDFNPGGLVAVWAEENTRAGVFDALQRREVYGTSGPRIKLRFGVADKTACKNPQATLDVPMGGSINAAPGDAPWFTVQVAKDAHQIAKVEIIKGELVHGQVREQVLKVASYAKGRATACEIWQDTDLDATAPAYWYARVSEVPTPRWSKHLCESAELCEKFPDADVLSSERAWSSPIWQVPQDTTN